MIIVNTITNSIFNFDNVLSIEASHNGKCFTLNICDCDRSSYKLVARFANKDNLVDAMTKIIDYYNTNQKVVYIKDIMEEDNDTNRTQSRNN